MEIFKRTFEAAKFPKGSPERDKLNLDSRTSEYMTSYKYVVIGEKFSKTFRNKQEAEYYLTMVKGYTLPTNK